MKHLSIAALAALLAVGVQPPRAHAQGGPLAMHTAASRAEADEAEELSTALRRGGYAVVIDLDENRLYFRQGDAVLWSAPIGTGQALRLKADDREWDFSTPRGVFHVQYKEENPTWIAPDWYFIENGLPVPPPDHKSRYFPGGLGSAAIYIEHDLAIHGTDKPELLGQRVSHGCIRMENRYAQRLFHNVQIGTEVIIVGGEGIRKRTVMASDLKKPTPKKPKPQPKDPVLEGWKAMDTDGLVAELEDQLWAGADDTRWTEVAGLLVDRGLADKDDRALAALLSGVGDLPNRQVEREYRTFLADAFARGPQRTLAVMSRMDRRDRDRAAAAIVAATMGLHGGEMDAPTVPWPTRRLPEAAVEWAERRGWEALAEAEEDFRRRADGVVERRTI